MDIATLLGMLGAIAVIAAAILFGGSASSFIDTPSVLIVIGGGTLVNLMKFPLGDTLGAFKVASRAFFHRSMGPQALTNECVELAKVARREGLLELENREIGNEFLNKGVQMAIDGVDDNLVKYLLNKEINLTIERHESGEAIFRGFGDAFPAMGMIGTLIGLVQMMANMSDPKAIGPAMAVALLTTLYGAILANTICIPVAEKLAFRTAEERRNRQLILEAVNGIQTGIQPRVLESLLGTYLPEQKPETAKDAAKAEKAA
ncbi:flagellar motor component [Spongiibacter sp. IMCC21906]|uniref:MotA/TolQ/ExbB proton channel family protein n=1 Tax=Spongiibacter sp. IMCC21906 TaxID=1620392 RepID=UPI00062DD46F|nr:MotA/TolQ/ExbB proton channel family protein [Spongiibacter sp. IMCC21906]AKH70076.1 flagellar motor component [Spongiibacter sp. IMCC21906]